MPGAGMMLYVRGNRGSMWGMMKGLGRPLAWVLALGLGCLTASAHEDTMLELKDGKLVVSEEWREFRKMPEEYLPMEYDAATHRVRVGKREMRMIEFLKAFFPEDGKYKISFSASWYHDFESPGSLPPYLLIKIEPEGRQFRYELLLNMKELDVEVELGGGSSRGLPVDLSEWREEIRKSITVVEKK